jgi:hypothetical protein
MEKVEGMIRSLRRRERKEGIGPRGKPRGVEMVET